MIDDPRSTESPQESPDSDENLEELRAEDAVADIDIEAAFSEAEQSDDANSQETAGEATDASKADSTPAAELEKQIAALKAQLEDRTTQHMRLAADFENYRKRVSKEREDLEAQAKASAISELLPVIDNFERARAQIKPQTEPEMTIHKSYQSVYKQLVDCLKRMGVSVMRAEGQEFDPAFHEAVMREPTDEYPEGVVMEELVRGYLLGDRVLRHAMVKVAAAPEPSAEDEKDSSESESPAE